MVTQPLSSRDFVSLRVTLSDDRNVTAANLQRVIDLEEHPRSVPFDLRQALLACVRLLGESLDLLTAEPPQEIAQRVHDLKRTVHRGFRGSVRFSSSVAENSTIEVLNEIVLQGLFFEFRLLRERTTEGAEVRYLFISWDPNSPTSDKSDALFKFLGLDAERLQDLVDAEEELGQGWQVVSDDVQKISIYLQLNSNSAQSTTN